jgi:predicted dienelactone hydrolase
MSRHRYRRYFSIFLIIKLKARMKQSHLRIFAICLMSAAGATAQAQQTYTIARADNKTLAIKVYAVPKQSCLGVAIMSPGAGGSEQGLSYLGQGMASLGYFSVVVGHQESGMQALKQHRQGAGLRSALAALITDTSAYQGRFMDIAAAKAWAAERCDGPKAILLGHSMGAATTMITAGAKNLLGLTSSTSFDIYVALSPQGVGAIFPEHAWQEIRKPVLTITGTQDDELGGLSWKSRLAPFQNMPSGCKWSAVIDDASHMNLGGSGFSGNTSKLAMYSIRAFLDGIEIADCSAPPAKNGLQIHTK